MVTKSSLLGFNSIPCMVLVNSLLGSDETVPGHFALTDCDALFLLPLSCYFCLLSVIFVCAAKGKLQVTTGKSVSSLLQIFLSFFLPF